METENESGNDPKEEGLKAIEDALTRANISGGVVFDYEESPNDAELADPADGVRVEFGCLDELDRFLRILRNSEAVSDSLCHRIVPSTNGAYPPDFWYYSLDPVDPSELAIHDPCSNGNLCYQVEVLFPATDLPEVLEILRKHNAKPENRRVPPTTEQEVTS